jgi:sugar phosphate isomerase/epimerase
MTYQIPRGAYPKNWTSSPDPPKEREVCVELIAGMEIHFEKSMDPYVRDEVRDATYEVLNEVVELAKKKGVVLALEIDIDAIERWYVYPEHLPAEMEEIA